MPNKPQITLIIPEWVNKAPIGHHTASFYKEGDKLPKKHADATLRKKGKIKFYVDGRGRNIMKNKAKVGTVKYWNLNGQDFYNNNMHWTTRKKVVDFYHKYFTGYIIDQIKNPFPAYLNYRLDISITIREVYSKFTPDIVNMWILPKLFEDALVNTKLLQDDNPQYRMQIEYKYDFIEEEKDRELVIEFNYNKY